MTRAWELFKNIDGALFSECLKEAWRESKNNIETMLKNIISNSQLNDDAIIIKKKQKMYDKNNYIILNDVKYHKDYIARLIREDNEQ